MKTLIFVMILSVSTSVFAVPKKYTNCGNKVNTPNNGTGFYFNENCSTAYVLPPKAGSVRLSGMTKTVSLDMCSGIVNEQKMFAQEENRLLRNLEQVSESQAPVSEDLKEKCSDYEKRKSSLELKIENLSQELERNLRTIDSLSGDASKTAKAQAQYLLAKNANIRNAISNLKMRLISLRQDSSSCHVTAASEDSSEKKEVIKAELNRLREEQKSALDSFKNYEGARLQLIFEDNHQDLVDAYSQVNSSLKGVTFVKMPVDWSVAFNVKSLEALDFESILHSSVPAVGTDLKISPISSQEGTSVFGGSLSASVVLNLPSTCFLLAQMKNSTDIASAVSINSFYRYDLQTKKSYKVEYNMRYVYEFIKKSTSKRGFFKSSSSTEVKEFVDHDKSFKMLFYSEDPDNAFPSEQEFLKTIRGNVLDLALKDLGGRYNGTPEAPTVPQAGVKDVAGALSYCPNLYCQAGSIVLNLAHALFGSGSSSASYLKSISDHVVEEVTDLRMISEYGSMAFDPKRQ